MIFASCSAAVWPTLAILTTMTFCLWCFQCNMMFPVQRRIDFAHTDLSFFPTLSVNFLSMSWIIILNYDNFRPGSIIFSPTNMISALVKGMPQLCAEPVVQGLSLTFAWAMFHRFNPCMKAQLVVLPCSSSRSRYGASLEAVTPLPLVPAWWTTALGVLWIGDHGTREGSRS